MVAFKASMDGQGDTNHVHLETCLVELWSYRVPPPPPESSDSEDVSDLTEYSIHFIAQ